MKQKLSDLISNFDLYNLCVTDETTVNTLSHHNKTISTFTTEMLSMMNKADFSYNPLNDNGIKGNTEYVMSFESFIQQEPSPKTQSYMGGINEEDDFPEEEEEE